MRALDGLIVQADEGACVATGLLARSLRGHVLVEVGDGHQAAADGLAGGLGAGAGLQGREGLVALGVVDHALADRHALQAQGALDDRHARVAVLVVVVVAALVLGAGAGVVLAVADLRRARVGVLVQVVAVARGLGDERALSGALALAGAGAVAVRVLVTVEGRATLGVLLVGGAVTVVVKTVAADLDGVRVDGLVRVVAVTGLGGGEAILWRAQALLDVDTEAIAVTVVEVHGAITRRVGVERTIAVLIDVVAAELHGAGVDHALQVVVIVAVAAAVGADRGLADGAHLVVAVAVTVVIAALVDLAIAVVVQTIADLGGALVDQVVAVVAVARLRADVGTGGLAAAELVVAVGAVAVRVQVLVEDRAALGVDVVGVTGAVLVGGVAADLGLAWVDVHCVVVAVAAAVHADLRRRADGGDHHVVQAPRLVAGGLIQGGGEAQGGRVGGVGHDGGDALVGLVPAAARAALLRTAGVGVALGPDLLAVDEELTGFAIPGVDLDEVELDLQGLVQRDVAELVLGVGAGAELVDAAQDRAKGAAGGGLGGRGGPARRHAS